MAWQYKLKNKERPKEAERLHDGYWPFEQGPREQASLVKLVEAGAWPKGKKVKIINGRPHRKRRGRWVEIPWEWVGHVTHPQKQRKRKVRAKDKHIGRRRRRRRSRQRYGP